MQQAQSKTILLTGGASGIGAAIARAAAAQGHRVIVSDIDSDGAGRVADGIGPQASALALDITSDAQWQAALDFAWSRHGGLDVLLNNAAIVCPGNASAISIAAHEATMAVNALGPMRGMLAALPRFKAQASGHFVTVCSMTAFLPFPGLASYAAAKHALRSFHHGLALEERDGPLAFTIVHPTSTETPMLEKEAHSDIPLAFMGAAVSAEHVAGIVLDAMQQKTEEVCMPPERARFVKETGTDLDALRRLVIDGEVIGKRNLAARLDSARAAERG